MLFHKFYVYFCVPLQYDLLEDSCFTLFISVYYWQNEQFMLFVLWEAEQKSELFRRRSDLCLMSLYCYQKTPGVVLSVTGTIPKSEPGHCSLGNNSGTNT